MTTNTDYASAELRALAMTHPRLAKAGPTFDAATGVPTDLATVRAAEIFNVPEAQVTSTQRDHAKMRLHAELYGGRRDLFTNRAQERANMYGSADAQRTNAQNADMRGQQNAGAQNTWCHGPRTGRWNK